MVIQSKQLKLGKCVCELLPPASEKIRVRNSYSQVRERKYIIVVLRKFSKKWSRAKSSDT
jgi:hypothetical protein